MCRLTVRSPWGDESRSADLTLIEMPRFDLSGYAGIAHDPLGGYEIPGTRVLDRNRQVVFWIGSGLFLQLVHSLKAELPYPKSIDPHLASETANTEKAIISVAFRRGVRGK
jgi:hypothetical protein